MVPVRDRDEHYLSELIPAIRISAEATVMIRPKGQTIRQIIHQESAGADVVFLGLDPPENEDDMASYAERLVELSESLRNVFFVKNSSLFVGQLVQTAEEVAASPPDAAPDGSKPQDSPTVGSPT